MHQDHNPARISACPVHFIWDGRGKGRTLVRAGFLGFLATGVALTGALALKVEVMNTVGLGLLALSFASYGIGQVMSFVATQKFRASLSGS